MGWPMTTVAFWEDAHNQINNSTGASCLSVQGGLANFRALACPMPTVDEPLRSSRPFLCLATTAERPPANLDMRTAGHLWIEQVL